MKKIFISDLRVGPINDVFLIQGIERALTREDKPYFRLSLKDRTGEIQGYIFDDVELFKELKEGIFRVKGEVNEYNGKLNVKIKEIEPRSENEYGMEDFIGSSPRKIEDMIEELKSGIKKIENPHLHKLIFAIFKDERIYKGFLKTPAAKDHHHNYISGLLEHTLNVVKIVERLHSIYPDLDLDILRAGAFLHDIGKIFSYKIDRGIEITDKGRLLDHIYLGCKIIEDKISESPEFPEDLKLRVLHIIVSHHGEKDWGALAEPMTQEAALISLADLIDMTMFKFKKAIEEGGEERWSPFQRNLNRAVFLGGEEE